MQLQMPNFMAFFILQTFVLDKGLNRLTRETSDSYCQNVHALQRQR